MSTLKSATSTTSTYLARMPAIHHKSPSIIRSLTLLLLVTIASCFFLPKLTTRFCYNSSDPARVNSQCVYCNYYLFDSVLLGCTGSSALTVNITATQAFCVISQCLGQIRQAPVFLGRRRRRRDLEEFGETSQLERGEDELSLSEFEALLGETTAGEAELSKQQVAQPDDTGARLTTSLAELDEQRKRRDALVQQEALDGLNLAAYTANDERAEDEVLETTTEIIEFNLNGEQNKYIVKKEVQAVIVDQSELEASYPIAG